MEGLLCAAGPALSLGTCIATCFQDASLREQVQGSRTGSWAVQFQACTLKLHCVGVSSRWSLVSTCQSYQQCTLVPLSLPSCLLESTGEPEWRWKRRQGGGLVVSEAASESLCSPQILFGFLEHDVKTTSILWKPYRGSASGSAPRPVLHSPVVSQVWPREQVLQAELACSAA